MIELISLAIAIGAFIIVFILARRFEDVFKWFDDGELHRTLGGIQSRLTWERKRDYAKKKRNKKR